MDTYQELIYVRSYARWVDPLKRRETWDETVARYFNFFDEHFRAHPNYKAIMETFRWAIGLVYEQEVMPSMRMLWAAGEALRRENLAGYNCVATPVDHVKVFSEILYLSMCGCGVGYSVERQFINKLPLLPKLLSKSQEVIEVADSKLGWAVAVNKFIRAIYNGSIPSMDVSGVRPAGARLKTFGGRAGGPELLTKLQDDITRIFKDSAGERLSSLDCHDIICHIGEAVISGGCRRTAFGSLSNLSDGRMAKCKAGDFGMTNPQRGYANNSVAYTERPDSRKFISEWLKLVESQSGERGIFNRIAAEAQVMKSGRRQGGYEWVTNPCFETILRPRGLCNLTEVIVREGDSLEYLQSKVKAATILGVCQSTLTDFGFVSPSYQRNAEEERLLGVSMTGVRDHYQLKINEYSTICWLESMRRHTIAMAKEMSDLLGINMPAAITTCKPSGTVSQLTGTSSGIHPRYSEYYLRRIRISRTDPLVKLLESSGLPWQPENSYTRENAPTVVFTFPVKSPDGAITTGDLTAIDQLEYWKMFKKYWCEHTASTTIHVRDSEWMEVGAWVYKNWDEIIGLSFLPEDSGSYRQAPFEAITKDEYEAAPKIKIDFTKLSDFEKADNTEGAKEYACAGGGCEI